MKHTLRNLTLGIPAAALLAAALTAAPAAATAQARSADRTTTEALADEIRSADSRPGDLNANRLLVVPVRGPMPERGAALSLLTRKSDSLKDHLDLLRRAREDRTVRGVALRLSDASIGIAGAQELRNAVAELRARGKKTTALLETDSQVAYLVAAACDEIVAPPSGGLMLHGVKGDAYFLRGLLAKVGVTAEVLHVGRYKAAGEMFTEDGFTTPARENMTELVDDLYGQMIDVLVESRGKTREEAVAVVNRGPMTADEAKEAGLVDRVAYAEELLQERRKDGATVVAKSDYDKTGSARGAELTPLSLLMGMSRPSSGGGDSAESRLPQVAVLYAVGPIVLGSSEGVFGTEEQIASNDFLETIDEIQKDAKIRAVIVRVNSPGGSAFASDLIWRRMEELKKNKPVVVTMGDVAASGGYYIAMGANRIVAQPGTLTGSIGVVGGKADLAGLYDMLGVRKESVTRGAFAGLMSETGGFTDMERVAIERMMRHTYDDFVAKAAAGRGKTPEQMDELAQGRVWTGQRAKEAGLVDELGGMGRAIDEVKNLLGMKPDEKVALVAYPKEVGLMDVLRKALGREVTAGVGGAPLPGLAGAASGLLPEPLAGVLATARTTARMLERERVLMVMPFVPVIR